ncbi:MAG: ABC transporter ATP-binding protein [Clostridium chrysemydis]|uniref:ABC transporter ATP-binding protein n=1 Tax=Clostridium chrysemydis TaxID=2665504 RepID=UPI003F3DCE96
MSYLSLKNIKKIYGKNDYEVRALDGIDLEVNKAEMIAIMGASGCGKSTLLNILGCIDVPTSGEYFIDKKLVDFNKLSSLNEIRNKEISFIFQNFALIKELSVINNIILPLKFRKGNKKDILEKAEFFIKELGIEGLKNKNVRNLSGGQQQRVAIARALCQETDIILADEPTGALDEENSIKIMSILKDLNIKYGKTIIVVTHDNLVSSYCDRKLKMKDGRWS